MGATYPVRSRPPTYYTGRTAAGLQILLGWVSDFIGALFFDRAGGLVDTREYPLGIDLRKGLGPAVEAIAHQKARAVKRELGFRNRAIRVRPFCVERWRVGLKQFPIDLEDYLAHPEHFDGEDAECYRRDIEQWKTDKRSVLSWGNDHHLDKRGNSI